MRNVLLQLSLTRGCVLNYCRVQFKMRGIVAVIYLSGYLNVALAKRSNSIRSDITSVEDSRQHIESIELPDSKGYLPGSLIKLSNSNLNNNTLVYGNLDNLGITFDITPERQWYSGFRKGSDPLEKLLKFIKNISRNKENHSTNKKREKEMRIQNLLNNRGQIAFDMSPEIRSKLNKKTEKIQAFLNNRIPVIQARLPLHKKTKFIQDFLNNQVKGEIGENNKLKITEEENNANEVLDQFSPEEDSEDEFWHPEHRRMRGKKKKDRDSKYKSSSNSKSFESASSDYEKNPGNPYTIHKDKYKKNWLWNHVMDGNHMNINPLAPQFANNGPSGAELFFGRKWWYYNQDDYKPMA